jgi:hypothetical protein
MADSLDVKPAPGEDKRSQQILRVPRNQTPAKLAVDGEESANVLLFVPPGEPVARLYAEDSPFVPVRYSAGVRLVARRAIAFVTIQATDAVVEPELALEQQRVRVHVRGRAIEGELRWIAAHDSRRTIDCLNDPMTYVVVYHGDEVSYIAKSHITSVEEL